MEALKAPVSIALAGLGDVSLQHQCAIRACASAQLVGAWTRDREKLARLATEWEVKPYPEYDALLEDAAVEIA